MATQYATINKANLTDKCGSNVSYNNPGENGTSYYFCFPRGNFQVVTGAASSIWQSHPRITFSVWYFTGDPGETGEQNRVLLISGKTIEKETTVTIFHNQEGSSGETYHVDGTYHLFRLDAIRNRGEGDQCHVYYHPEPISGMSDTLYNNHFKNHKIYGIANTTPYIINGRGWSTDVLSHFNLTSRRGSPITTSLSSCITNGRWGSGV